MRFDDKCVIAGVLPIAVIIIIVATFQARRGDARMRQEKTRILSSGITAAMLIFWPILFGLVVGWHVVAKNPIVIVGFIWAAVILVWDIYTSCAHPETGSDAQKRVADTKTNANIIVGAAWAVGALLAVINTQGRTQPARGARILLMALVMCIAFVIPIILDIDPRTLMARSVRAAQRSVLQYSIGLFVAGIIVSWVHKEENVVQAVVGNVSRF